MRERMNLNMEDLEMVNGGTDNESFLLALLLIAEGKGNYLCSDGSHIVADTDKIADFFESRGWNFIPSADGANIYVDNNGLRVNHEKIRDVIRDNKF